MTLIHSDAIDSLKARLSAYREHFGLNPGIFVLQDNLEAGPLVSS